jgi:putative hydroxymethylpyrimidine transporter CytX
MTTEMVTPRGLEPVGREARQLGAWGFAVLWGDLGIGLLVLLAGSFLVPALSLPQALGAIVVGSVIGVTLLGLTGIVGSQTGLPTMVCLRPALGRGGSYVATAFNVVQLLGWTVFELVIMGHAANAVLRGLTGFDAAWLWIVVFGGAVIALGLWGPVAVVREWLTKFALGAVVLTTAWLTWRLFDRVDVGALWSAPAAGGLSFWAAVDIVIAMPISWLPLVSDYSRFAQRPDAAFWGTTGGYLVANVWFYALGALILLSMRTSYEPKAFVEAIALLAGPLVLLVLLADETDEAWADLYSCAVSIQNAFPRASVRSLVGGLGAVSVLLALAFDVTRYEDFLLLIGAVFVPLFGVLAADYFVVRRGHYAPTALLAAAGTGGVVPGVRWQGAVAWALGVGAYLWIAGRLEPLGLAGLPAIGASLPSLGLAAAAYLAVSLGEATTGRGRAGS